tara:strand:- start:1844 stop:3130 length:1287 start_codon:yes stop_codon:yes gene_type:complete
MIPSELIEKKRDGKSLSRNEISSFIKAFSKGQIEDSQMSAMLMSIYFNGMNKDELFSLTESMISSGEKIKFAKGNSYIADKHSTGGIGDKISIPLAPILASLNIRVPMIVGRSLAFTGGTADKLDSIQNFKTETSSKNFKNWVDKIGVAIITQSEEICPADKKIYALRDITATVPSIPLICSSIMSKKIAEGIQGLVIDIKVGNGAFMKSIKQAKELGKWLKSIGEEFNVSTDIIFTSMDQPLGSFAGLKCEILESIDILKGNGPDDSTKLVYEIASKIIMKAQIRADPESSIKLIEEVIKSGLAKQKFNEMILNQGGNPDNLFVDNNRKIENDFILSKKTGYVNSFNTENIGWSLVELGCGRKNKLDSLNYDSGINFLKKTGDRVKKGDPLLKVFSNDISKMNKAKSILSKSIKIGDKKKNFRLFLD